MTFISHWRMAGFWELLASSGKKHKWSVKATDPAEQRLELDLMILVVPFQPRIFSDLLCRGVVGLHLSIMCCCELHT